MQTKIVIANTLKPVDDVRGYEKIAQSIAKTNKYQVNIIGNTGKKESDHPSIKFHEHDISRKNLFGRIVSRINIMQMIFRINPSIIIVQTHELLYVTVIHKLLRRSKIIYDVREDYKKNMQYLSRWPYLLRLILAISIRTKERLLTPFIDQFWLAEKCYLYEINFPRKRSHVLENKALLIDQSSLRSDGIHCLYTGTISEYGGIFLALDVYKKMKEHEPQATLTIVGQCHDPKLLRDLNSFSETDKGIKLSISENPVDHTEIVKHILKATLGIISYQSNPVNANKVPTKLYEYSLYRLPFLIQQETPWEEKGKRLGGAIPIDFENPNVSIIIDQLKSREYFFHSNYPDGQTWNSQEGKISDYLNALL
ncbi:MAG: hypothetical protein ABJP45_10655 [Cyclobacteriaceae bacterium]